MSMELMVKAMKAKVGNPLRKLVLIKLADNANDQGECWPSHQHIADQCEIGNSTVRKHIAELVKAGFVSIKSRKGPKGNLTNIYTITICHEVAYGVPPDSRGCHQIAEGVPSDSRGGTPPDSTGISHSFEPVNESLKDYTPPAKNLDLVAGKANAKSTRVTLPSAGLDFSSWPALPSEQVFADWVAIRKLKKSPLTQTAVNCLAKPLAAAVAAGYAVDDIFALCATRGWIAFKLDWLTNAGLERANGVASDWAHLVFNPEDPLV